MATSTEKKNTIDDLVKALSLDQYYPEKLSVEDLYEITGLSLEVSENVTQQNMFRIFINRITRYNYNARNIKIDAAVSAPKPAGYLQRRKQAQLDNTTNFHPMDIVVAVFLCCEPIAKQDLIRFMWGCKLSVPFSLQLDDAKSPFIYMWPLRSLVSQWQVHGEAIANEYPIFNYPMQKVGFVRIGTLTKSKSALLNGIIGGPEKAHPMFFHRDSFGSQKQRSSVVDGLVELGWYFPKGAKSDRFDKCIMFANLRGDASTHQQQLKLLIETMDMIVIISHTRYLLSTSDILRETVRNSKKTLLVLTDEQIAKKQNDRIEFLLEQIGEYDESSFEILPVEETMLADKLELLCNFIKQMQPNAYESLYTSFMCKDTLKDDIDENMHKTIKRGMQFAKDIIDGMEIRIKNNRKCSILPCQGNIWKEWTETEIETKRLDLFSERGAEGNVLAYLDSLEVKKHKLRKEQCALIKSLPKEIFFFIECLERLGDAELRVFLRTLKFGLDEVSRKMLRPYYTKYKHILEEKVKADKNENDKLDMKLEQLDKEKTTLSFGLEHLVRELGQIYEACLSQEDLISELTLSKDRKISYAKLPCLAARILFHGYPVEIMDGDVGFVPEKWITDVLDSLRKTLEQRDAETSLHIISVLGIQSSGKSTLLNTLFGLQFAVSAGRCTKGVFMQMIRVSKDLQKELGYNYVIAIDTEGLRASKMSSQTSIKFDNEISCFAIGLADNTVVNLMGESAKYLEENLPVVVHAFLRMDMIGLKPQCVIVHQNVDKSNKDKLMEQGRLLEKVLNELTAKACDIEGKEHKRFKDIIKFDVSEHTDYIPSLLEGDQPMGPISSAYSSECNCLRKKILDRSKTNSRHLQLTQFKEHLINLSKAIKEDQFVFEFRSTVETQARLQLDEHYSEIHRSVLTAISKLSEEANVSLNSSRPGSNLKECYVKVMEELKKRINTVGNEHRKFLIEYVEDSNKVYGNIMSQWKKKILQKFDSNLEEATADCVRQFEKTYRKHQSRNPHLTFESMKSEDVLSLKEIISEEKAKHKYLVDRNLAEHIWSRWLFPKDSVTPCATVDTSFIKRDVENFLYEIFKSDKHKIEKALGPDKTLQETSLDSFFVLDRHIKTMDKFLDKIKFTENRYEVEKLLNIMKDTVKREIINACKTPYSKSIVRRVLLDTSIFLERNKSKFAQTFKIDVCVNVAGHLATALSHNERKMRAEEKANLQQQKQSGIAIIMALMQQERDNLILICTQQIVDLVLKEIVKNTVTYLYIWVSSFQWFNRSSKLHCINYLLGIAVERGDLDSLDLYLTDPETALTQMLKTFISNDDMKKDGLKDFLRRMDKFSKELSKHEPGQQGLDEFLLKIFKNSNISVSEQYIKQIKSLDLNTSVIQQRIAKEIHSLKIGKGKWNDLLMGEIDKNESYLKHRAAEYFLKGKMGCCERCPFCGEICIYETSKHIGPHQTRTHRPTGIKGVFNVTSNEVATDTCSSLVVSRSSIKIENEFLYFKDYKSMFPNWEIKGETSIESSSLWKWYFANHFKRPFQMQLSVPPSWKLITRKAVARALLSECGTLNFTMTRSQQKTPTPKGSMVGSFCD